MRSTPVVAAASLLAGLTLTPRSALPCSSIVVSKGASTDGSSMVTYAADSHELYGEVVIRPPMVGAPGSTQDVYEWDTGKLLGKIKQAPKTYNVVGNINERQVSIAETTWGGRPELVDPDGVVDYGSLIFIALQRAATAREAIRVITDLAAEYGYASSGESFSIADPHEAWTMDLIGKGPGNKGAVWVARRVPDGMVTAHANHARISTFPLNDAKDTLYAKDVISFARAKGYFTGKDEDFSFTDAYAPATYSSMRACELRVWSVFRRIAPSQKLTPDFLKDPKKRLPLWIKPDKKLSTADVMDLMRDHFEGTEFDLAKGLGAGPYEVPYRWRPLTWPVDGVEYMHDRAISTQQTGFSMVTQSRAWLPDPVGGVMWFGVDDTASSVYVPMYGSITRAPKSFSVGTGDFHKFTWESAFWVFNWVANMSYARYKDMIGDIKVQQGELEGNFLARQAEVEARAVALYKASPAEARDFLTGYSVAQGDMVTARWRSLGEALLVKYLDGNVRDEKGNIKHPRYSAEWYKRIVKDNPELYKVRHYPGEKQEHEPARVTGFFHSREELGALGVDVPASFPFATEKLLLVPGKNLCKEPPRCCAEAKADAKGEKLVITVPEEPKSSCGPRGWLVRLPKDEKRPLFTPSED